MHRSKTEHATRVDWAEQLARLDAGEYGKAVVKLESDSPDDDPAHALWRAECRLWSDEVSGAREELEGVELHGDLAARAALVLAEADLWDNATRATETTAAEVAARVTDLRLHARAVSLVARAALRRGEWVEALRRIAPAREEAQAAGLAHLEAILDNSEAYALLALERGPTPGLIAVRAVTAFVRLHDERWEAVARTVYGLWLLKMNRPEAAEVEFSRSIYLSRRVGIMREAIWAENDLAQIYIADGRLEEAARLLEYLLDWERSGRYVLAEANGLVSLAYTYTLLNRSVDAMRAGVEAVSLAAMADSPDVRLDARLVLAWVKARAGDDAATSTLRRLRSEAISGTEEQRFRAALYLADAIFPERPDEAAELLAEAARSPEAASGLTYAGLLDFVRHRAGAQPIHVNALGELVYSVRHDLPALYAGRDTAERFLVWAAIRRAEGNMAEAGRQLKITRMKMKEKLDKHGWPADVRRPGRGGSR